jgi:hypothetical protein
MPFSFGGNKSESQSSGFSSSFSNQDSLSRAVSQSVSGGASEAVSQSTSQGSTTQAIAFEDVFANLFGSAQQAAGALDSSILVDASNQLFSGGTDFISQINDNAGTNYLESRLSDDNRVLQEQIDLLSADIGDFFSEEINPAITSSSVASGQLGGGRQGVAQGIAAGEAGELFTRGATELRAGDIAARDAIASGLANNAISGAQVGIQGSSQLLDIANVGFGAELEPFARLAAILGDPTVLSQSQDIAQSSSASTAEDFARAFSESFGTSTGRAGSVSRTQSSSRSGGFNLGFGK